MVYPVGRSTERSLFTGIIAYNYKVFFCPIGPKFGTYIHLWLPYMCAKFQLYRSMDSRVRVVVVFLRKEEEKNQEHKLIMKLCSIVSRKRQHDLLQFWIIASSYRQALPQRIWCSSDKR